MKKKEGSPGKPKFDETTVRDPNAPVIAAVIAILFDGGDE